MKEIARVVHSTGNYPVYRVELLEIRELTRRSLTISDRNVDRALELEAAVVVRPGESSKSLRSYSRLQEVVARSGLRRDGTISAVGGGVVGDLAGFVAATYMRGVRLVQVPTSLLAMVDSSVGGKVGVDLAAGKNLVGAFHQPQEVWIAPEALRTLPRRHLRNGAAEVLKYGFIMDPSILAGTHEALRSGDWMPVVQRSVELKSEVVQEDEFETTGRRAILNFGHTVGHAIENLLGYRRLLHGEAIAIGMVAEAKFGEAMGVTPEGIAHEVESHVRKVGLPTTIPPNLEPASLVQVMSVDKKADRNGLAMSLLTGWGTCKLLKGIDARLLEECLSRP